MKDAADILNKIAEAEHLLGQARRMVVEGNPCMLALAIGFANGLLMTLAAKIEADSPQTTN